MKRPFVLALILIVALVSYYLYRTNFQPTNQPHPTPVPTEQAIKDGCTRTERLKNDPQYDRALSLIQQRIDDNEKWCDKYCETADHEKELRFHHFPANLANCIKIIEKDIDSGADGYFVFNDEDIKPNYFPITIDDSYALSDDVLTAMLITHEMTHVQQYLSGLNGDDALSCRDKEVAAFVSQLDFYLTLNNEEETSVWLKMANDRKHPQIVLLKTMIEINKDSKCGMLDSECRDRNLKGKLFDLITQDPTYQKQCEL